MISAHSSMGIRYYFVGVGAIINFSMGCLKKLYEGGKSGEI